MKLVVDTSALLTVVLSEPSRSIVIEAATGYDIIAPSVLPYEVGNALTSLRKRKVLKDGEVLSAWTSFSLMTIDLCDVDIPAALVLAARHNIYAYDAYVVQTALQHRGSLLTLDKRMISVAQSEGVQLRGVSKP
jgi:predicted nucleic acid-binding protein